MNKTRAWRTTVKKMKDNHVYILEKIKMEAVVGFGINVVILIKIQDPKRIAWRTPSSPRLIPHLTMTPLLKIGRKYGI
jgi:hypothetical protein